LGDSGFTLDLIGEKTYKSICDRLVVSDRVNTRHISLQIQLSATAVASSFALIFVPSVETISFTAFIAGFLFPLPFAMSTILTMTLTWEIFASMVFGFSGITFPFKIVSWVLIGLLGNLSRKVSARYFYEFAIFGAISAFVFDLIVTISTAIIFISSDEAFLTVFITSFILGFIYTVTHTISNALLFSFIPVILRVLLPLLHEHYQDIVKIPKEFFDYLKDVNDRRAIIKLSLPRVSIYVFVAILILVSLIVMSINYAEETSPPQEDEEILVSFVIDYSGVLNQESHMIETPSNYSVFDILLSIANVSYEDYPTGVLITGINNVVQDQNLTNHYWIFYVNGDRSNRGASITYLMNNDLVEWSYEN